MVALHELSNDIIASVTATDNGEGGLNFDVTYRGGEGEEKLNTIVNRYRANGKIQTWRKQDLDWSRLARRRTVYFYL